MSAIKACTQDELFHTMLGSHVRCLVILFYLRKLPTPDIFQSIKFNSSEGWKMWTTTLINWVTYYTSENFIKVLYWRFEKLRATNLFSVFMVCMVTFDNQNLYIFQLLFREKWKHLDIYLLESIFCKNFMRAKNNCAFYICFQVNILAQLYSS